MIPTFRQNSTALAQKMTELRVEKKRPINYPISQNFPL